MLETKKQKTIMLIVMFIVILIAHFTGEKVMGVSFTPTESVDLSTSNRV